METEPITITIFRKYRDGSIIALFPELPGTNLPGTCACYMHVGQHDSADYHGVIASTEPAKPNEYAALRRELESNPYNYRIAPRERRPRHIPIGGK